ncbi:MAG: recombination protein RecR [Clostridia bacterium]|nr:recombination protein RecR [Clostridia bacterium]
MYSIEALNVLQEWFAKMPGVGPKSAMRMAYKVIEMDPDEVRQFAQDMYKARVTIRKCSVCGNLTDQEVCPICEDETRDKSIICVVKDSRDVMAIERGRQYKGVYFVLGGLLSPLDGIGPEDIGIQRLIDRVKTEDIKEVIIATNPDVKGEATAIYIYNQLSKLDVNVTRIAHGVPVGGELEYTDDVTLSKALEGRRRFE